MRRGPLVALLVVLTGFALFASVPRRGDDTIRSDEGRSHAGSVLNVRAIGLHRTGLATGVLVGDELVLTVAHVLTGADRVFVESRPACLLVLDERRDAAILTVAGLRGSPVAMADDVEPGEARLIRPPDERGRPRVVAPVGVRREVTARVDEPGGEAVHERATLVLDSAVSPGDSGAPVLDGSGRLQGLVFATSRQRRHTSYAVAVEELAPLVSVAEARFDGTHARGAACDV